MRARRHTPPARPGPARLHAAVTVRWGEMVLVSRMLTDGETITVGAAAGSLAPIPCDALGVAAAVVASSRAGIPVAHVPARAIAFHERSGQIPRPVPGPSEVPLGAGETVSFSMGTFLVTVSASTAPEVSVHTRARLSSALAAAALVTLAALSHALVLGLSAQRAQAASLEDTTPAVEAISRYLAAAEARTAAAEQPLTGDAGVSMGKHVDAHEGNGEAAGGARAAGTEGKMGSALERAGARGRYAVAGVEKNTGQNTISRAEALADARSFGLAGVLASEGARSPSVFFGEETASGGDALGARGDLWGTSIAETFGAGGLGLSGIGEGGAGTFEGIGLGRIGLGFGVGSAGGTGGSGSVIFVPRHEYLRGSYGRSCYGGCRPRGPILAVLFGGPSLRPLGADPFPGETSKRPGLDAPPVSDSVQRVTMGARESFRSCYARSLKWDPEREAPSGDGGTVVTSLVVTASGKVASAVNASATLPSPEVAVCVAGVFRSLTFEPRADGRPLGVVYPVSFSVRYR